MSVEAGEAAEQVGELGAPMLKRSRLDQIPDIGVTGVGHTVSAFMNGMTRSNSLHLEEPSSFLTPFKSAQAPSSIASPFGNLRMPTTYANDGGVTTESDANRHNQVTTCRIPMSLKYYPSIARAPILLSHITPCLPLFLIKDEEEEVEVNEPQNYHNLPRVNNILRAKRLSKKKIVKNFIPTGYLLEVEDLHHILKPMHMLGNVIIRGVVDSAVDVWATCDIPPLAGNHLFLLLVKRTEGYEEEETRAYADGKATLLFDRIEKNLADKYHGMVCSAKKSSRNKQQRVAEMARSKTKLKSLQYWTVIPHVSKTAQPDLKMLRGIDWDGHAWHVGISFGDGMDMADTPGPVSFARSVVTQESLMRDEESGSWKRNCATIKVFLCSEPTLVF